MFAYNNHQSKDLGNFILVFLYLVFQSCNHNKFFPIAATYNFIGEKNDMIAL